MTRLSPDVQRPLRGVATPPAALPQRQPTDRPQTASFYRVVWRWHFYAGIIAAPVLLVVAATGALYIFKVELERVLYPGTMFVDPAAEHVSLDDQLAAAIGAAGEGFAASQLVIVLLGERVVRLARGWQKKEARDGTMPAACPETHNSSALTWSKQPWRPRRCSKPRRLRNRLTAQRSNRPPWH